MALWTKDQVLSKVWAPNILEGKVVFCTGGAGTICSAQVAALVLLGCNAAILGRSLPKTTSVAAHIASLRPGSTVLALTADVRSPPSLDSAVQEAIQKLGQIDFVICGAAGNFLAPVTALSANAFKSVVDIDLLGSYNTVKAVLPHLRETASAGERVTKKILFISATMHYTGIPFQAHAAAAKAGVDALSATLAVELGPLGITSNVVAPGPIHGTAGMDRLKGPGVSEKDVSEAVPLQRQGAVRDIADATVWLLSEAGDWVTGAVVVVDGGSWRMQPGRTPGWPGVMGLDWEEAVGRRKKNSMGVKL
ncbi:hypothetical protein EV426DRAFT_634447 [Tirmania nivea]|nr:hypothetical protein EV426DRAFT_634447 [Tirmania nivea]